MAAKKTTPNKSAFIRSQPDTLSAADVIAKGKAAGLKISSSLVYMVRGRSTAKAKKAPAKKPAVKATAPSNTTTVSKADFVRSRSHLSPKEIVEDAKKAGLKLDVGYIYNVRGAAKTAAKKKGAATRATVASLKPAASTNGGRPSTGTVTPSKAEDLLKAVAAELGLGRAMEILAGERARVRAVIGGSASTRTNGMGGTSGRPEGGAS